MVFIIKKEIEKIVLNNVFCSFLYEGECIFFGSGFCCFVFWS